MPICNNTKRIQVYSYPPLIIKANKCVIRQKKANYRSKFKSIIKSNKNEDHNSLLVGLHRFIAQLSRLGSGLNVKAQDVGANQISSF